MKILVTGARGFIAKNLIAELSFHEGIEIFQHTRDTKQDKFEAYCKEADFVFHLAGINRPTDPSEFMDGNYGLTSSLVNTLKMLNNSCPIVVSSSTQAELENPYGISKKAGEELLKEYSLETGSKVMIYRLPNVFGKWSRPNYNSVIATFCHNISRSIPIKVDNPDTFLNLVYIDDLIKEFIKALKGEGNKINENYYAIPTIHTCTLGEIADLLSSYYESRSNLQIPNMEDPFSKKLYSTYLSYLPKNEFSYELKMNKDSRGSFTEFIKTLDRGQVSINVSKPGITKGNHWHHTKNEKFLVVSGTGVIRFRNIESQDIIEYFVNGEKLEVVDIPPGYTHNIENLGQNDMVTVMWANELFNPATPDTLFMEV
ncbi:NAD-dependent epimerase/dehydratase family protein [Rossellomorea marisflavi]|uniref:polysaccharide biosynthesis C-terminal domain-containing protein n=1 Tax=Rossellomorea marisflavi TaxID=189381 RepID=UPI003AE5248A